MPKQTLSQIKRSINRRGRPATGSVGASGEGSSTSSSNSKDEDYQEQADAETRLYVPNADLDLEWHPAFSAVFKILFSFRMAAALWSSISDCDEVYNYWEPLHMFLYGKGFQTWEYSPVYAIRSYLYILLYYGPAYLLRLVFTSRNKIGVFMTLRCIMGLFEVCSELALYKAVCSRLGNGIGRLYIALTIFSAGMFLSSCAFLPSTFSMILNTFAVAAYLNRQWFLSVLSTAVSALVGWPFAAVLGLPVVLQMLLASPRRLLFSFFNYSLWAGSAVIMALVFVDSYYYGKYVLAPLNIVLYNIFSSHGPNLYGVEKVSFYVFNLLLNWNIAVPLAVVAVPLAAYAFIRIRCSQQQQSHRYHLDLSFKFWQPFLPVLFIFLSLAVWLGIFFAQPHKEERFLFPVYPLIAVLAAVALDAIPRVGMHFIGAGSRRFWYGFLLLCLGIFTALSLSRSMAVYRNYSAPLKVYKGLYEHLSDPTSLDPKRFDPRNRTSAVHVCVGKEWYRFPSSFFIPSKLVDRNGFHWDVELNFIKSEFAGLLPKPFANGVLPDVTRIIPTEMNDLNQEEPSRYLPVEQCDFLVDLETPDTAASEPNYAKQKDVWRSIVKSPFLLSAHSDPLYRAFFIPYTGNSKLKFGTYHLLYRV